MLVPRFFSCTVELGMVSATTTNSSDIQIAGADADLSKSQLSLDIIGFHHCCWTQLPKHAEQLQTCYLQVLDGNQSSLAEFDQGLWPLFLNTEGLPTGGMGSHSSRLGSIHQSQGRWAARVIR